MPSPFPGMDPYLEHAKLWPAFQHQLLACLYQILLPGLVDRYRARVRRPGVIRAFLALPRSIRRAIGGGLRRMSTAEKRIKAPTIMDVNPGAVEATLRAHGYPRLIHGHTHRPSRHVHVVDGHVCERFVLGDWYERGSYLRCDERGCEAVILD